MTSISPLFEKSIAKLLLELPARARSIVKRRYGIGQQEGFTLEAIGQKEGITRERVRQIENDAMRKLKKSQAFLAQASHEEYIDQIIEHAGGVMAEYQLLRLPELASVKDKNTLVFFLDLCQSLIRRKADDNFHARWHRKDTPLVKIENALSGLASDLKDQKSTLDGEKIQERLAEYLKKYGVDNGKSIALPVYLALSKNIEQNTWGEYGHVDSPFVRPRGMRESAFVALSRAKNPLHFRDIAKHIGDFTSRPVHVQTVHNELIKDERFVLVGRGLYALREWGYEPGFIKDVLVRVLKEQGPLTREKILAEALKRRQVKPSTVFINLQNKNLFKSQDDGTYTLIS